MSTMKKSATPVAILAAVLSIGLLSACGSNPASEPTSTTTSASASESASREAGVFTKEIQVETINQSGNGIMVAQQEVRAVGTGAQPHFRGYTLDTKDLGDGSNTSFTNDEPRIVVTGQHDNKADTFDFDNPVAGKPMVIIFLKNGKEEHALIEGSIFTWKSPTTGRTYEFKRGNDTDDLKHFTVTVK